MEQQKSNLPSRRASGDSLTVSEITAVTVQKPEVIKMICMTRNFDQVYAARKDIPSFRQIAIDESMEKAVKVIAMIIERFNMRFNEASRLSPEACILLAEDILLEFPNYQPTELALCLRNAASGKYGERYGELDVNKIMIWMQKYNEERAWEIEGRRHKEHQDAKKGKPSNSEGAKKVLKMIAEGAKKNIQESPAPEREKKPTHFTSLEQYCKYKDISTDHAIAKRLEFENEWHKMSMSSNPSPLTKNEYVTYRESQYLNQINKPKNQKQ